MRSGGSEYYIDNGLSVAYARTYIERYDSFQENRG